MKRAQEAFCRTWVPRLVAIGFALGGLVHFASWVLLSWGVRVYGPQYPGWRHPVFTVIDASIASVAVRAPRWLPVPLALFAAEQTWDHGLGIEPVVIAIAALLSTWGAWQTRIETKHGRADR